MELNANNYYSLEADQKYFSASQVKSFMNCQAMALAEIKGEYKRPTSSALMLGSYVDAYFEGRIEAFKGEHPEIFNSRTGELKADYKKAEEMIKRAEQDKVFMEYLEGDKQKIFTGEIAGIPFKAKFDVYQEGKRIVDLKTVRDMESMYAEGKGRLNPLEYWNWTLQMAIYQELEGHKLPAYLAIITKEEPSDLRLIQIPQFVLDTELTILKENLPLFDAIKQGIIEPERCEHCAYCRGTHVITEPEQYNPEEA